MFDNYVAGLRGGLAAGLAVCLLLAYAGRGGRRTARVAVRAGAGVAAALALGLGHALTFGPQELTPRAREALGGTLSLAAVALLTWVVLRNRHTVRHPAAGLRTGTAVLAAAAFLAVAREGPDTALFLWAAVRAFGDGAHGPLAVVLLGLLTALVVVVALRLAAARPAPARFFRAAGVLLLLVAAGYLVDGVQALTEAELVGGPRRAAFDVGALVPPDSWYGAALEGAFGFRPAPTVLQVALWLLHLVPALLYVVRAPTRPTPRTTADSGSDRSPFPDKATVPDEG
ncbi:FTR1 family protein [Streptomyces sp. NPDC047123]|uniref:FTR1 family protein n=1 Tax=Streptomyces sp. NPDC047123 TaxID=3155622 RepID=UPI0033E0405A